MKFSVLLTFASMFLINATLVSASETTSLYDEGASSYASLHQEPQGKTKVKGKEAASDDSQDDIDTIKNLLTSREPYYLKTELAERNLQYYDNHHPYYAPLTLDGPRMGQSRFQIKGVILFSGSDPVSQGIKLLTQSAISHVGILLTDTGHDLHSGNPTDNWYCFEATGNPDEVLQGKYPFVRVTPYDHLIENYNGEFCYREFYVDDSPKINAGIRNKALDILYSDVTEFVAEYDFNAYETNFTEIVRCLFNKNGDAGDQNVFCSELVARMLYHYGFFPNSETFNNGTPVLDPNFGQANNFIPAEFSSAYKPALLLESGLRLTHEIPGKGFDILLKAASEGPGAAASGSLPSHLKPKCCAIM